MGSRYGVIIENFSKVSLLYSMIVTMYVFLFPAAGHGDPHYDTFDDRRYTFNGAGDFTLLEVLPEDSEVPIFTMQGRLGRVSFWRVTTHLGLSFGQPDLAFHVS